jgi:hypothetical protein
MTDPRLQPLLDMIAANIAAAVLAEMRARAPNENADESGQEQRRRGDQSNGTLPESQAVRVP